MNRFACRTSAALVLLVLFFVNLSAQDAERNQEPVKVCGEFIYESTADETPEAATRKAIEGARLKALEDKFGSSMRLVVTSSTRSSGNEEEEWFGLESRREVKGDWLEDIGTPVVETSISRQEQQNRRNRSNQQSGLMVTASVCGYAREITGASVEFSAKILKNGFNSSFESSRFKSGDAMYLLFQAPVDGYVAVYLVDDSRTAFCLLPYQRDRSGKAKVEGGKEYVFFSADHAERAVASLVDEYFLTCEKQVEHDLIYVVFSPNEFTKANDARADEETIPRTLSFDHFQTWLTNNRMRDNDMQHPVIIPITISK